AKARLLAEEAKKPGASLEDISYCFEGIGKPALAFLAPLLLDKRPEVAFAAARAAAYIGDDSMAAENSLFDMARTAHHPFQLNAVQVLGSLRNNEALNHLLRELLESDETLVRVEAYKILARNHDPSIYS